ncbi:MAG: hypothetical protein CVU89_15005 [Firmicutes bacterium HGW-Firmicutes-14]|nr:MAG: hypothetical protein CVU89_15005 [Firmicutes bacterium HGW-Firmicutes-14]
MVLTKRQLSEKERKILGFLNQEEVDQYNRLFMGIEALEQIALDRYQKYLEENRDPELTRLANDLGSGIIGAEERFAKAVREKLSKMLEKYGKFAFAIWDWEWRMDYYSDLTGGWREVNKYEIKTVCDFHCTVLADRKRDLNWAQEVFDKFFTLKSLRETIGVNTIGEDVDRVIHRVSRELVPVKYER